ncbi:hypothetical protein ACA910_012069 [Epithemia clementina (nom. ined.)]
MDDQIQQQQRKRKRWELPQHWVPPFQQRKPNPVVIPFNAEDLHDDMESKIQDTFHVLHVQATKSNNVAFSAADELFDEVRIKSEKVTAPHGESSSESGKRNLLRGLFESSAFSQSRSGSRPPRRSLSFTTEKDFVIVGEIDYSSRTGNSTASDYSNSTDLGDDFFLDGNFTDDESSSSVLTRSNATDGTNNGTSDGEFDDNASVSTPSNETGGGTFDGEEDDDEDSSSEVYQPIRIRALLSESHGGGEHLDPQQRETLLEDIVKPALVAWSEALRVPVSDPHKNLTLDPTQWLDGKTCGPGIDSGLPSAHVPVSHLKYGIPKTDVVVYLHLGFVYEPTAAPFAPTPRPASRPSSPTVQPSRKPSAPFPPSPMPTAKDMVEPPSPATDVTGVLDSQPSRSPMPSPSKQTAAPPRSVGFGARSRSRDGTPSRAPESAPSSSTIPTQSPSNVRNPKPQCAGDYLASSIFCSTNEIDRPTAALLHICIGQEFFDPKYLQRNIMTIMHELGHALGFNLQSLAHFRRSDESPITPRDSKGAIPEQLVECTGPQIPGGRPKAMMQLPSPEILQFRTVRGGVRVAEVVTPSVAQVVRNHFDCQELVGAELESGEALPLSTNPGEMSCIGSHWERRLFKMDIMNPLVEELRFEPLVSILTLAYFADSGWYQVDLSRAAFPAIWGRAAGCAFVEEPCIQPNGQVVSGSNEIFCNSLSNIDSQGYVTTLDGCTPDLTHKAACTMSQYDGELPAQYQYFSMTYGSNVGGQDPFMDYCPVYNGLKNGLCSDPNNEEILRVSSTERVGSPNSRCLSSHSSPSGSRMALCLRIACVVQDKSLRVQVEGQWHKCEYEGQLISSQNGKESIFCPNPVRVCPTFYCPRDCLGTSRMCNYTLGECVSPCTYVVQGMTYVMDPLANGTCPDVGMIPTDPSPDGEEPGNPHSSGSGDSWDRGSSDSPFLIPEDDGSPSPKTGSPLSDIYFPDERTLEAEDRVSQHGGILNSLKKRGRASFAWKFCFIAILILLVLPLLLVRKKRKSSVAAAAAGSSNDDDGGEGRTAARSTEGLPSGLRRNKDKMIATVLVDLRMNDPNLNNFRDVLVQRGSETDRSMTDTDPGSFVPWDEHQPQPSREFSLEPSFEDSGGGELPPSLRFETAGWRNHSFDPLQMRQPPLTRRHPSLTRRPLRNNNNDDTADVTATTILNRPPLPRGGATIRRRFFRRRNTRTTTRNRPSGVTDTLRS